MSLYHITYPEQTPSLANTQIKNGFNLLLTLEALRLQPRNRTSGIILRNASILHGI